jgi:membrane protein implicated in regulation of membrane protease activity
MISMTVIWAVIALAMLGGEFLTAGILLIFFSFGAALAAIASFLGVGIGWQMGIFAAGSLVSAALGRPFLMKYFRIDKDVQASTTDAMVGLRGVVVQEIAPLKFGQVRVRGDVWTASCEDDCLLVEGSEIEVIRVDGVKLLVRPSVNR